MSSGYNVTMVLAAMLLLAGAACSTAPSNGSLPATESIGEPKCRNSELHGCNHPSGIAFEIRNDVRASWIYAQLSENAYDRPGLILPALVVEQAQWAHPNDDIDLAYRVYVIDQPDGSQTIAMVFRGTELSHWKDTWYGNIWGSQARRALTEFERVAAAYPGKKMVVAGHSLGGSIALYISSKKKGVDAFVFNTSLRGTRVGNPQGNKVISFAQYAEILGIHRRFVLNPDASYNVINCSRSNAILKSLPNHSMRLLAACLTNIAAWIEPSADTSLSINKLGERHATIEPEEPVAL